MRGFRAPGIVAFAAVAATAVLVGPGTSPAGPLGPGAREQADPGASSAVTLRVGVDASGRGTFMAQGAVSDAGTARVRRAVGGGRLTLVQTLVGENGSLVVRAVQRCGGSSSTWSVVRGTGGYLGLTGGGRGTAASCSRPGPLRAVYRGSVRLSAPPTYAAPGSYGGWTSQGERITFDVPPGGRVVSNLRVERLVALCAPPLEVVVEPAFRSTYALSGDGTFATSSGDVDVAGRFAPGGAAGTIAYDAASGVGGTCSTGPVTWTARTPPDALPTALPGAYCGSTTQSLGACVTMTPDGRLTQLRLEVTVECTLPEQATFDAVVAFGGLVPTRANLRFEVQGGFDEGASGDVVVRGAFDTTGAVSGTVSLHRVTVDLEGTIFTCRNAAHGWAARRLG